MRKKQDNLKFSGKLLFWYNRHKRGLPWRRTKDPYKIWVSEIMLQQTTVNAVIPYYRKWVKKFPDIKALNRARLQTVLKEWQGLGYYNRARNIKKCARVLCRNYQGQIPQDPAIVKKLPGFGPYTTGAVLSIAYDLPLTIIDANVRRVIMRVLGIQARANTGQDKTIESFLNKVFPAKHCGDFNQALMELGAMICKNQNPQCLICPVSGFCEAKDKGIQEIIPLKESKDIQKIRAVVAVIKKGAKFFIQKRSSKGLLADLWEFPGGKIEKNETALKALRREMLEELDCRVSVRKRLGEIKHFYTRFSVRLEVYLCEAKSLPLLNEYRKWVTISQLKQYPLPSGSAKIIEKFLKP